MIDRDYCRVMARYNDWQNRQIKTALEGLSTKDLMQDRGAFFGSIMGTLNHLLWADRIWMGRFAGHEAPGCGIAESSALTATVEEWALERFRTDSAIRLWADGLRTLDLTGPMSWMSVATGQEQEAPVALCILHMFNHQTHHRGQVHAMLTAAGAVGPVSDIAFMPREGMGL